MTLDRMLNIKITTTNIHDNNQCVSLGMEKCPACPLTLCWIIYFKDLLLNNKNINEELAYWFKYNICLEYLEKVLELYYPQHLYYFNKMKVLI